MQENLGTYTYTARDANNPNKVVTFTLNDGHMRVNLTGILEQAGKVAQADEKTDEIKAHLADQVKPAAVKLAENISGPFHISDVNAQLDGERLQVSLWQRAGGLRLSRVNFNMGEIDNYEAAQAFVEEVKDRQRQTDTISKFFGPLDYWVGWVGFSLLLFFLFRRPKTNNQ